MLSEAKEIANKLIMWTLDHTCYKRLFTLTNNHRMITMTDLEKLEYIHCTIQEVQNDIIDDHMIVQALSFVEDLREPYLQDGNNDH